MIKVREYSEKDFRFVEDICLENSRFADNQTPTNRAVLCAGYTDYYLDEEPQFCFVAADDETPIGYILCAADSDNFREMMTEAYLPLVRKISSSDYFKLASELKVGAHYAKQGFTARLQIAVLPEFQHQGVGAMLLQALLDKLKDMFVEGVYAVCEQKNEAAKALFGKFGFDDIDYLSGEVVFGKKIYTEDPQ